MQNWMTPRSTWTGCLKEEVMLIKERLNKDDLTSFTTSNVCLEKLKPAYGIRETRITSKPDNIPRMTIQSWIERLPELATDYELKKICNIDELGLFFKALTEKCLVQKLRSCKDCKKSKQRFTAAFFVAVHGSKVSEPVTVWKSKSPRCFKNIQNKAKPRIVHYLSNNKAWIRTEIMENVLGRLDRKLRFEGRKVIFFLDNAPCHPETLQKSLTNMKLILLPKCNMYRFQPLSWCWYNQSVQM